MALPGMALPPSPYRVSTLVSVTPAVSPSVCLCVSQPSVPLSLVAPASLFSERVQQSAQVSVTKGTR